VLTGVIVLSVPASVAPAAEAFTLGQQSGLRDLESMRLADVGRTIADWRLMLLIASTVLILVLLWGGDAIRPGSLQRAGLRNVKPLPTPVWLMAACITLLAPMLVAAPVSQMTALTGPAPESLRGLAVVQGVAYLAGIAVAVGLAVMAARAAPQSGLKVSWIDGAVGVGLLLIVLPLVLLVGDLASMIHQSLANEGASRIAHPLLRTMVDNATDPWTWVLIGAAVLGAPIVEEIVYRGFVQSGLLRLTGHAWVSLIVTAVIFGAVHTLGAPEGASPWYAAVQVGVLGLCCGAAFERTKRIGVPIAMHAAFNAANVAVAMWVVAD
jgi:membrane protease YdiL (CAAX protease family)